MCQAKQLTYVVQLVEVLGAPDLIQLCTGLPQLVSKGLLCLVIIAACAETHHLPPKVFQLLLCERSSPVRYNIHHSCWAS